ncbi:MAG: NAD-dependent epimerase/dehydratase family protein [Anaerolineae bacterium]|nr:NAD-dependent epimerase/dehydratase family protein [Anaerolineae bacterium]MCO5194325.1 NAD-dependent epimerase/dehydratase family protein [Anaerolineae bacterium]MCO5208008.1 NAD-dependent epimerase/dehydratase family protein [Anaerolineae bacterium]
MNDMLHIVLGGSGGVGRAVVTHLSERGKRVRAVNRSGQIADLADGVEVRAADALNRESVVNVCADAGVIYHCVHPKEKYEQMVPMTENIIAAAEATGALLVMAASVYPYGKVSGPMTETLPHKPEAPSGEYHARAAELVMEAHRTSRIPATIGRASNYFGPHACRMWPGIDFKVAIKNEKMQIIGKKEPLHTYTYVYDFADGLITLGEREEAHGQIWHLPSAPTITTQQFLDMIYAETGTTPNVQVGPRPILRIMSLFNADIRPALDVFYQFDRPFVVDHSKFERAFGAYPTPHKEAIAQTVQWARNDLANGGR